MTSARSGAASVAAALLALLLLSFASVQSVVMQSAMASARATAAICGDGADAPSSMTMTMTHVGGQSHVVKAGPGHSARAPDGHNSRCPYCAAAAHAPVMTQAVPLFPTVNCVFASYRVKASQGPRGPPALRPRARDPPSSFLTA